MGGDFRFFWRENILDFSSIPQAWDASLNTGIGKPQIGTLWINSYLYFSTTFSHLGLSWDVITFLFWILPSIIIAFLSPYLLLSFLGIKHRRYKVLAGMIYIINTYSLMVMFGGQLGVLIAYSFMPLVFLRFLKLSHKSNLFNSLAVGLVLSLQLFFDPRFFYLSLLLIGAYLIFGGGWRSISLKKIILWFFIPFGTVLLIHSFWIVPLIYFKSPSLPDGFDTTAGFKFFSFADFPHAFSLLHPNWPENIFGKISFYKPEFMFLPIIAFIALFYFKRVKDNDIKLINEKKMVLFFALILISSAFLGKGANDPFGEINVFLFQYIPGMYLFRDSTKFYAITAVAYSALIPIAFLNISENLPKKRKNYSFYLLLIFILSYLGILFSQLYIQNSAVFESKKIPQEYVLLKDMIVGEGAYFRTFWVPQWQRYGYFSNLNPAIGRGEVLSFASPISMAKSLKKDGIIDRLQGLGVKYIILPYDSLGEFFINDRKYDEQIYTKTKLELDTNTHLSKKKNFGKIHIYELKDWKDRFYLASNSNIRWRANSVTEYEIELENDKIGDRLIFSDSFDPNWVAIWGNEVVSSKAFNKSLNSFDIPKGVRFVKIYYTPQDLVNKGLIISGTSLFLVLIGLVYLGRKK